MSTPEPGPEPAPDPGLAGAGLSATSRTADQFRPGQDGPGTTYGDPGGTGTAEQEASAAEPGTDAGQDASGNAEGQADPA